MAEKTVMLTFLVILILQHNYGSMALSGNNIHPPPAIPRVLLRSPQPPSPGWYTINDDKVGEGDAFRPTTPGHSPGVGHDSPPNFHA